MNESEWPEVQNDDHPSSDLDRALSEAATALLDEIRAEPVPLSIKVLAEQLQAALDQKLRDRDDTAVE